MLQQGGCLANKHFLCERAGSFANTHRKSWLQKHPSWNVGGPHPVTKRSQCIGPKQAIVGSYSALCTSVNY